MLLSRACAKNKTNKQNSVTVYPPLSPGQHTHSHTHTQFTHTLTPDSHTNVEGFGPVVIETPFYGA